MAIRVMMVDQDINHMKEVKQYFSSSSSVDVVKTISSKEEALNSLNECDVIILNMLLNGMDSMAILSELKKQNVNKIVIATSEFVSSEMMEHLNMYHANYFIKKPFTNEALERVITSICKMDNKVSDREIELKVEITNLLHSLGIPSHIKGYTYIRDGIAMLYKDSSLIGAITKELYPSIASNYSTTSSRVERAIRHAIEVSWMRGDYSLMEELFGNSVDYDRSKPTNSEFIVTLADRLKLQNKFA